MRILVTGSRDLEDRDLVHSVLFDLWFQHGYPFTVIHGDCKTGADSFADCFAEDMELEPERYPAEDFGPWPACGPKRNSHMVSTNPDICLGFFKRGAKNKGTTDCLVKAVQAGIPVRTFWSE